MKRKTNQSQIWQALTMVLQFGLNMIVPIVLCTFLGIWIGRKTGVEWLVIPFFFVGALAGFNSIYKMSKQMMRSSRHEDRREEHVKKTK